ncbi:hypothetical protein BU23DRAFT_632012 [Bimuria novae-zelandiae CBS 107.79]|uniref:Uncharacterized protein n=1 Tax=Bimuria novae-zelandiae CBS 107.79 TaxID=1447943 RepID=A0A6A5UI63_9PLEO|nr:hypothetical protein BU23DRAFT_632012 [Bimuria novae-zelandiae CBS 107.79]
MARRFYTPYLGLIDLLPAAVPPTMTETCAHFSNDGFDNVTPVTYNANVLRGENMDALNPRHQLADNSWNAVQPDLHQQLQDAAQSESEVSREHEAGSIPRQIKHEPNLSAIDPALLPQEPPPRLSTPYAVSSNMRMLNFPNLQIHQMDYTAESLRDQMAPPANLAIQHPLRMADASTNPAPKTGFRNVVVHGFANISYGFEALPSLDYDFRTMLQGYGRDVNFTAVEIIVFLPKLFFNEAIARRFVNNGMENPEHVEILERHRPLGFKCTDIGPKYLVALNPKHLQALLNRVPWNRKNHKTPPGWDGTRLSINDFVPDRVAAEGPYASQPPGVPFRILMDGMTQMPVGDDAADLTRAINFACGEEANKMFPGHEFVFPHDLRFILQKIGHATITPVQQDRSIVHRYRKVVKANRKNKKEASPGKSAAAPQSYPTNNLMKNSRAQKPQYLPSPPFQADPWTHDTGSYPSLPAVPMNSSPFQPRQFEVHDNLQRAEDQHVRPHENGLLRDLDMASIPLHLSHIPASEIWSTVELFRRPDKLGIARPPTAEEIGNIEGILHRELSEWQKHWQTHEAERYRHCDATVGSLHNGHEFQFEHKGSMTEDEFIDLFGEPAPDRLTAVADVDRMVD